MRRDMNRFWYKLVPGIWKHAAFSCYRTQQCIYHEQAARYLPTAAVSRRSTTPIMTGKSRARRRNNSRNLFKNRGVDPGLKCSELEGVFLVKALKQKLEVFEYRFKFRVLKRKELFPIPPRSNKFPVVQIVLDQIVD